MHNVFWSLFLYQCQSITYQMLHWISAVGDRCGRAGGLGHTHAAATQGCGTTRSCRLMKKENPSSWQNWPVGAAATPDPTPAELRAALCFPSLQPCSVQAALLLWSCWSQAP